MKEQNFENISGGASMTKKQWLAFICQSPEYEAPCEPNQLWECVLDVGEYRIRKCRNKHHNFLSLTSGENCVCPGDEDSSNEEYIKSGDYLEVRHPPDLIIDHHVKDGKLFDSFERKLDAYERRLQRRFLKEHVNKEFRPIFIGATAASLSSSLPSSQSWSSMSSLQSSSRLRRGIPEDFAVDEFDINGVYELNRLLVASLSKEAANHTEFLVNNIEKRIKGSSQSKNKNNGCVIFTNQSISCPNEVYQNKGIWKKKKERLDNLIKKLQMKLDELKGIRRHLKEKRPLVQKLNQEHDQEPQYGRGFGRCDCNLKSNQENDRSHIVHYARTNYQNRRHHHYKQHHWRLKEDKLRKKERKLKRKTKFENTTCNFEKMNCFAHNNDHWKTAPFWTSKSY